MQRPISKYLKAVQENSKDIYSEIFVMDNQGLNVGQSNITSDYWQGDEDKFKKTYGSKKDSIFIDDVEFDQSSGKFQSQISMTILDDNKELIGAITVGINIEKELLLENVNNY